MSGTFLEAKRFLTPFTVPLGEIAHLLDRRRREQSGQGSQHGAERFMVCFSSRSPNPDVLLRKGVRLADRLDAPWYAVYIQTPGENLEKIDAATQRQVANTQSLAHQLGGVPQTFKGGDLISTIATFVREYGITYVVLGRTRQPWYRRWFGRSVLDRLLRAVPGVDVLVVDTA